MRSRSPSTLQASRTGSLPCATPPCPATNTYERAQKYLPLGTSGVMSVDIKGGRGAGHAVHGQPAACLQRGPRGGYPYLRAASGQRNPPPAHGRAARCRRYRAGPCAGFGRLWKMWRTLSRTLTRLSLSSAEAAVWKQRHAKHRFLSNRRFSLCISDRSSRATATFSSAATRAFYRYFRPATMQSRRRTPSARSNCCMHGTPYADCLIAEDDDGAPCAYLPARAHLVE